MRFGVDSYARSGAGAAGSVVVHIVAALALSFFASRVPEPEPAKEYELTEFELPEPEPEPEPEKPPEPEPEPEEPPEPEVIPEVKKEPPPEKPAKRPKNVKDAPVDDQPVSDEPPPPFRMDASQTTQNGNSGVKVTAGTPGGTPGGTGDPNSRGQGSRPKDSQVGDGGAAWEPRGELYIRDLPQVLNVPKENCPAVQELGIQGVVILTVQVRRDGSVRDVKVNRDIGHGCGKVAARALRKAKFRPALATNGQPADFELRFEYEFQLND